MSLSWAQDMEPSASLSQHGTVVGLFMRIAMGMAQLLSVAPMDSYVLATATAFMDVAVGVLVFHQPCPEPPSQPRVAGRGMLWVASKQYGTHHSSTALPALTCLVLVREGRTAVHTHSKVGLCGRCRRVGWLDIFHGLHSAIRSGCLQAGLGGMTDGPG